jgi:translation initiation factor 3 subunit J
MSDWEGSDSESSAEGPPPTPAPKAAAPAPAVPAVAKKPAKPSKWEGEDEEDEVASDWEESSEEEVEQKPAPAPPKKKGTLKAKLAEKEAEKAAKRNEDDSDYDSDAVLNPRDKAKHDKERELKADMSNAADLLGAAAYGGTASSELDSLISLQPRTKEDFQTLSERIIEFITKRHESKPLYHTFVEHHARALCASLKDVEVRKVASGLTTLANEKQKEQRERASNKKKPKSTVKPALGGTKSAAKVDTDLYEEALDDFGTNPGDFM